MNTARGLLLSFVPIFFFSSSILAVASPVTISGRQLLVNGQPFVVKGVNYSPTPIGRTLASQLGCNNALYEWWTDRPAYLKDFPLIARMGGNTIRTYAAMNPTNTSSQLRQALDAAQAHQLYVIMGYFASTTADFSNASTRAQIQSEFTAAVAAYKDHPAVLMWVLGNEQNLMNGANNPNWYSLIQQVAGAAKAIDPDHPIATVEGEIIGGLSWNIGKAFIGADDASLSNLDIWAINSYRGKTFADPALPLGSSPDNAAFNTLTSSTTKPVLVTEFGKDAYRDTANQEDRDMQASYLASQWPIIVDNLSTTAGKPLIGGVVFEWTDEWWKMSAPGSSCSAHDTGYLFTRTNDSIDPNYQEEWFGLVAPSPIDSVTNPDGTLRTPRQSYYTMQGFWNPSGRLPGEGGDGFFFDSVHNYPNPLVLGQGRGSTKFVVKTNEVGSVDLRIYDAGGQFVASLSGTVSNTLELDLFWDGRNSKGEMVSPGLYFARIHGQGVHEEIQFRRVVAVK